MRYILMSMVTLCLALSLSACGQYKWGAPKSDIKNFSPHLYDLGETFPARFENKAWDPAAWPLPYQDRDRFTRQLFESDIIYDQYILTKPFATTLIEPNFYNLSDVDQYKPVTYSDRNEIPVLVVGPNFYHLSDIDQYRVTNALDQLYGATRGEYGAYLLQDYHTKEMIGSYTKTGLNLR